MWGGSRGLGTARGTRHKRPFRPPRIWPDRVAPALWGEQTAGTLRPSYTPVRGLHLPAGGGRGGEEPGGGRPGRKQRVPSAAGGAGGCCAGRGPRLPVRARPLLFLVGALWVTSAAWPGPMAQTPDGISSELRGKRWPLPTWLGGGSAAPKPEANPAPPGVPGKHYSLLLQRAWLPAVHSTPSLRAHR